MTAEISTLFRKEVELAKVETREAEQRAAKASAFLAVGVVAALLALTLLSFALGWLLDEWMHQALAFLIVGVAWAVVAVALVVSGRQRLRDVETLPQTVGSLKEDLAWAKAQKS